MLARMAKSVALLRGINVGGNNRLPMKELIAIFAAAGGTEVSAYIQSGNILFRAPPGALKKLGLRVQEEIKNNYGFTVPVVLRTADEIHGLVSANPYLEDDTEADVSILMVMFLADQPKAASVAALDPTRSPPDEFTLRGREIFLRCPNTFAKTKLSNAYFDSKLGTVSTGRNWRTVLQLAELTRT